MIFPNLSFFHMIVTYWTGPLSLGIGLGLSLSLSLGYAFYAISSYLDYSSVSSARQFFFGKNWRKLENLKSSHDIQLAQRDA